MSRKLFLKKIDLLNGWIFFWKFADADSKLAFNFFVKCGNHNMKLKAIQINVISQANIIFERMDGDCQNPNECI